MEGGGGMAVEIARGLCRYGKHCRCDAGMGLLEKG
jgi:hypothetical protein